MWQVHKLVCKDLGIEIMPVFDVKVTNSGSSFDSFDPLAFYINIVKENLKDFYHDELNQRKALNACITLYHMCDWCSQGDKSQKKKIYSEIPHNNILENIANGTKHFNQNKEFKTGRVEGTLKPTRLIVAKGNEQYYLTDILKGIEKYWDKQYNIK